MYISLGFKLYEKYYKKIEFSHVYVLYIFAVYKTWINIIYTNNN